MSTHQAETINLVNRFTTLLNELNSILADITPSTNERLVKLVAELIESVEGWIGRLEFNDYVSLDPAWSYLEELIEMKNQIAVLAEREVFLEADQETE
jgi:hypothetical protein